jgi:hypothetical protein
MLCSTKNELQVIEGQSPVLWASGGDSDCLQGQGCPKGNYLRLVANNDTNLFG